MNINKPKTINIEKFKFPSKKVSVIEPLVYNYTTMPIVDENPVVIIRGLEVATSVERVKLLKALTLCTVNKNEDYAMLMTEILTVVLQQVVQKAPKLVVPMSLDSNKLKAMIVNEVNDFISKNVDTKKLPISETVRYANKGLQDLFVDEVLESDFKKEMLDIMFKEYESIKVDSAYYCTDNLCLDKVKTARCFVSSSRKADKCRTFNLDNGWMVQSSALTYNNGIIEDSIVMYIMPRGPESFRAYYAIYEPTTGTYQYYRRLGMESVLEECVAEDLLGGNV